MLKKIAAFIIIGMIVSGSSACSKNDEMISIENKTTYTEDDFVNLKSGTPYDEVVKIYGGSGDGWGNLVYTLEDGRTLLITISADKQVLFIETKQGDKIEPCLKWEEREKSETNRKSSTRHPKSDFDFIKEEMSFGEVEDKLGYDYKLIGNGFTIAKYLTEDFDWFIIACGQNNEVKAWGFAYEE